MKFIESKFVKELCEAAANMYRQGWDEGNAGNISYMIDREFIRDFFPIEKTLRKIDLGFVAPENVRNKYFLVTGAGKYFKNIAKDPEHNLGLVKISKDGTHAGLLWGFKGDGSFTSEFQAHLLSQSMRMKYNSKNRVIIHTHPLYTISMGACLPVDSKEFTKALWKTNTRAVVVFPDGVGVLPCMVFGTAECGEATAEQMKKHRIVSLVNHGVYAAGVDIDEALGLIETVEKTAQIYMLIVDNVENVIPDKVILGLAKQVNLKMMAGVIKEK